MGRIIRGASDDGFKATDDARKAKGGRSTYHGSTSQRSFREAQGKLHRMGSKPGGGSPRGWGRRP